MNHEQFFDEEIKKMNKTKNLLTPYQKNEKEAVDLKKIIIFRQTKNKFKNIKLKVVTQNDTLPPGLNPEKKRLFSTSLTKTNINDEFSKTSMFKSTGSLIRKMSSMSTFFKTGSNSKTQTGFTFYKKSNLKSSYISNTSLPMIKQGEDSIIDDLKIIKIKSSNFKKLKNAILDLDTHNIRIRDFAD